MTDAGSSDAEFADITGWCLMDDHDYCDGRLHDDDSPTQQKCRCECHSTSSVGSN